MAIPENRKKVMDAVIEILDTMGLTTAELHAYRLARDIVAEIQTCAEAMNEPMSPAKDCQIQLEVALDNAGEFVTDEYDAIEMAGLEYFPNDWRVERAPTRAEGDQPIDAPAVK